MSEIDPERACERLYRAPAIVRALQDGGAAHALGRLDCG